MKSTAIEYAIEAGAQCHRCPLNNCKRGPVRSTIIRSKLAIIGEAPSKIDVAAGANFTGQVGKELSKALKNQRVTKTNVLLCQPPDNRTLSEYLQDCKRAGKASPIECCMPRLRNELAKSGATTYSTLGKHAMETVAKLYKVKAHAITKQRGHPIKVSDTQYIVPTLHPAGALRSSRQYLPVIHDDIAMAMDIADSGIKWKKPHYTVIQTLEPLQQWLAEAKAIGAPLMVDIETTKKHPRLLFIIGIGQERPSGRSIRVIPVHSLDGSNILNTPEVRQVIATILNTMPLQGQNALFDTRELLRLKWMADRTKSWEDLRLYHANSRECDCPHDLNHISSRFGQFFVWKADHEHELISNLTPAELAAANERYWEYNAYDIDAQMASIAGVKQWAREDGTENQIKIDTMLQPIARDMGELGLLVDVERRNELASKCDGVIKTKLKVLQDLAWSKFNPASPQQVAKYIYTIKDCPRFQATGDEAQEGDKASTGEKALLKIIDHGVAQEVETFINELLAYRGYSKLRGTYLTDTHTRPTQIPGIEQLSYSVLVPGTSTGRLATNPNIQNQPSRGLINVKQIFVAAPGHKLVKSDLDQVEARIFAVVAGDRLVLEALEQGKDIHSLTAAKVFGQLYKGTTAEELYTRIMAAREAKDKASDEYKFCDFIRTVAKFIRFGKQFGAGANKLYQNLSTLRDKGTNERLFPNLNRNEVNRWNRLWDESNPWIKSWQSRVLREVAEKGYVEEAVDGRRRFFKSGYNSPNEPPNAEIQPAAAAYCNRAMITIGHQYPYQSLSEWTGLVAQVHDELTLQVPEQYAEGAAKELHAAMNHTFQGVPITADVAIVDRWG